MSKLDERLGRFIGHLEALRQREDRGALAGLRRGLGGRPGTVPETYPHVCPWTGGLSGDREDAFFLVASLFALHPEAKRLGFHRNSLMHK